MGCCQCCNKFFVGIVSIVAVGLVVAIVAVVVALSYTSLDFSKQFKIISIVFLVVCALLLIFAIYASCCGKKCARVTLSILLGVICAFWIVIAILVFVYKKNLKVFCIDLWDPSKYKDFKDFITGFEKESKCKGVTKYPKTTAVGVETCDGSINHIINVAVNAIGAISIVAAVILLAAIIAACIVPKKKGCENSSNP